MVIKYNSVIKWSPYSLWDEYGDEAQVVIFRLTKIYSGEGVFLNLGETTSALWKLLDGTRDVSKVLEDIQCAGGVKSLEYEHSVLSILGVFLESGLIEISSTRFGVRSIKWRGNESVYRPNYVFSRIEGDNLVLLNNTNSILVTLENDYARIWESIAENRTVNEIVSHLDRSSGGPHAAHIGLRLRYLSRIGMIRVGR